MRKRSTLILFCVFIFCITCSGYAAACESANDYNNHSSGVFTDLSPDHWAYSSVMIMKNQGAISGYDDGSFRPGAAVSRAEFAKMLVAVLDLPLASVDQQSFQDVKPGQVLHPYVETAKYYLTGFRTGNGDYFKPDQAGVREDIAVAICKALEMNEDNASASALNRFIDKNEISPNLLNWVALAVQEGLMQGSVDKHGNYTFSPQQSLSRAEAAVLLARLIDDGEKVVYSSEGEKVTYDSGTYSNNIEVTSSAYTANVTGSAAGSTIYLEWNPVNSYGFKYYKVVVSKYNPAPSYPDDGYMFVISNVNTTEAEITASDHYYGGDFGGYLTPGEEYYFSITAVYEQGKYAGNAVRIEFPESADSYIQSNNSVRTATVSASVQQGSIALSWNPVDASGFNYYKVVISKYDSQPSYPEDGYMFCISNVNQTTATITSSNKYNGGDFGGYLIPGEKYYFSITAVYNNEKNPGNAVRLTFPD